MSRRNYKPTEGLLGKYRVRGEVPPETPHVDISSLLELQEWRVAQYQKPILDDLLAWYRFSPVTTETAKAYAGINKPRARAVGQEAVKQLLANKQEMLAAGERRIVHTAENTEETLALFWMTAEMRRQVLHTTLSNVVRDEPLDPTTARYAAEAIEDMGDCISEPFEPKWDGKKRKVVPDEEILDAVRYYAPLAGSQISAFGRFAAENTDSLYSDTGIVLLQSAVEEQEYRIAAWEPRHQVLCEAFPDMQPSMDILLEHVPLEEMLRIQDSRR